VERLTRTPELLDGPLDDHATLAGNLRDLRRVNRLLGGVRLSARALEALAPDESSVTMLDVGTGGADIPRELIARWQRRGRRLRVVGLDSRPEIVAAAAAMPTATPVAQELELQVGDGRSLPYEDAAFDVVHASMVVHHLEPGEAAALLHEMGRLALTGAWLLAHGLTTNRFTRYDAPLSVRRAYTLDEVRAIAADVGVRVIHADWGVMRHRWAFAAVVGGDGTTR
jgi:ubiquinone/menaquinone biosynthesis C-methylase UbiE